MHILMSLLLLTRPWTASGADLVEDQEGTLSLVQSAVRLLNQHGENKGNLSRMTTLARDTANGVLYYHVHVPKCGGTTLSNIIVSSMCGHDNDAVSRPLDWEHRCGVKCAHAMVDTETSCMTPWREEHMKFNLISERVDDLKQHYPISKVVYITTLRRGPKRIISHWAHEMNNLETWAPPPSVPPMSNESLLLYLEGKNWANNWPVAEGISQRNNLQVATLAAVPGDMEVTAEHLEQAKKRLRTGQWIIGFTDCLPPLHHKLRTLGSGPTFNMTLPTLEHASPKYVTFSSQVMDALWTQSRFDEELYEWAWQRSPADLKCDFQDLHSLVTFPLFDY